MTFRSEAGKTHVPGPSFRRTHDRATSASRQSFLSHTACTSKWGMTATIAKTVLVVDDDKDIRDTLRDALEMAGYRIIEAADGHEALSRLRSLEDLGDLCLVLADVHMPRLDGPALARAIRADAQLEHVRILVLSSSPEYAAGLADEILTKPCDLNELRNAVARLCCNDDA